MRFTLKLIQNANNPNLYAFDKTKTYLFILYFYIFFLSKNQIYLCAIAEINLSDLIEPK
jgi:hypothetical protein